MALTTKQRDSYGTKKHVIIQCCDNCKECEVSHIVKHIYMCFNTCRLGF